MKLDQFMSCAEDVTFRFLQFDMVIVQLRILKISFNYNYNSKSFRLQEKTGLQVSAAVRVVNLLCCNFQNEKSWR